MIFKNPSPIEGFFVLCDIYIKSFNHEKHIT